MAFIVVTMFFSGGLIPFYMQVRNVGLMNTRLAVVLPFSLSAWNVIIARTYFQSSIPESLHESAIIDGASKIRILLSIIVPLSAPIIAVITLWCAVGFWNSYFWAMILIQDTRKAPIQIFLVTILTGGESRTFGGQVGDQDMSKRVGVYEQLKYVAIVITVAPILFVYPFLQRYFIKGVMIGALKG